MFIFHSHVAKIYLCFKTLLQRVFLASLEKEVPFKMHFRDGCFSLGKAAGHLTNLTLSFVPELKRGRCCNSQGWMNQNGRQQKGTSYQQGENTLKYEGKVRKRMLKKIKKQNSASSKNLWARWRVPLSQIWNRKSGRQCKWLFQALLAGLHVKIYALISVTDTIQNSK